MDIRRSLFGQVIAAGLIVGLFGAHAVAVDHLGGGTNGDTTTGTTSITDDGYGNTGLIVGLVAGAVGGVALIWYLASRRGSRFRSFVTGCVQPGTTPGCQRSRVRWRFKPSTSYQFLPPSSERNSAPGSTPHHMVSGREGRSGTTCQMRLSVRPRSDAKLSPSQDFRQVFPPFRLT